MNEAEIVCRVKEFNLKIRDKVYSEKYPEDVIISQIPEPGIESTKKNIEVVVSKGKPLTEVPEVIGLKIEEAIKLLISKGLTIGTTEYVESSEEKGTVLSISPPSGSKTPFNTPVYLKISKGKKLVKVPKITGKTLIQAQRILKKYGLRIGTIKKRTDIERPFGIILKQYPPYGKKVPAGSEVTIIINEEAE